MEPLLGQGNNDPCSLRTLPAELQKRLGAEFSSWKVQKPSDLSETAKVRWHSAKYAGCPGLDVGEFRENKRQSYAVLLVPREKPDSAYRMIIFTPSAPEFKQEFQVVDSGNAVGASNFFLHIVRTEKLFDTTSLSTYQIRTKEALLLFDAGKDEYEVDVYYWSDDGYRSLPLDV